MAPPGRRDGLGTAFCYILEQHRETPNARHNPVEVAKTLSRIAEEIGDYGEFNFPLTDGDHLYTYTNMPGKLHHLIRHPHTTAQPGY